LIKQLSLEVGDVIVKLIFVACYGLNFAEPLFGSWFDEYRDSINETISCFLSCFEAIDRFVQIQFHYEIPKKSPPRADCRSVQNANISD